MTKHEFLDILNTQLAGQLSSSDTASHVAYYRDYIDTEIKNGRKESDILDDLGDPRLIARTIIDTSPTSSIYGDSPEYSGSSENRYFTEPDPLYSDSDSGRFRKHRYHLDLTTWYSKLLVIILAVVVILLLFILMGIRIPVAVIVFLIAFLISRFRR